MPRSMKNVVFVLVMAALVGAFAVSDSLRAATIRVNVLAGSDYVDLQAAIDAAEDRDTVLVAPGEYVITEPLDFNRLHDPNDPGRHPVKNITVRSEAGPDATIIRMADPRTLPAAARKHGSVVVFSSGEDHRSALEGFRVTGGFGTTFDGPCTELCPIYGGGILCVMRSSPIVTDCIVVRNSAVLGGGIACNDSSPIFRNCIVSGNASIIGAGVNVNPGSSPTLFNCVISGNTALESGGGLYAGISTAPRVNNCVVWANKGGSIDQLDSFLKVSHSCIQGNAVWPGEGNINEDPLFVRLSTRGDNGTPENFSDDVWIEGDFRLRSDSPCIDAGMFHGSPTAGLLGVGRPCGVAADMGAYESGDCRVASVRFLRGDANADSRRDISDSMITLMYLFANGAEPRCTDGADTDDSNSLDLTDAVFLLNYLFSGGPGPIDPFIECGIDRTNDDLRCDQTVSCL